MTIDTTINTAIIILVAIIEWYNYFSRQKKIIIKLKWKERIIIFLCYTLYFIIINMI